MKNITVRLLPVIVVGCSTLLFLIMLYVLNAHEQALIEEFVSKPVEHSLADMAAEFEPMEAKLVKVRDQMRSNKVPLTAGMDVKTVVRRFSSLILLGELTSLGIADDKGREIDLRPSKGLIVSRSVVKDSVYWSVWKRDDQGRWKRKNRVSNPSDIDPRNRPWYTGAMAAGPGTVHVTDPYTYNTTGEPGITMSTWLVDSAGTFNGILAFDLSLADLTDVLNRNKPHAMSELFILDPDTLILAHTELKDPPSPDASGGPRAETASLNAAYAWLKTCMQSWLQTDVKGTDFTFSHQGKEYLGAVHKMSLGGESNLFIGSTLPQETFSSKLVQSRRIIVLSSLGLFLLMLVALRANQLRGKYLNQLQRINADSRKMSHELREKNQEIRKSMMYAKQIQGAIMSKSDILRSIYPNSFVIHTPLEVVGGDFYWASEKDGLRILALADCTGHGIPSALISMLGAQAFHKAVHELDQTRPAEILNTISAMIRESFSSESQQLPDGMDVSVIAIREHPTNGIEVTWAGANSIIWIVRKYRSEKDEEHFSKQGNNQQLYPTETGMLIELKSANNSIGSMVPSKPFMDRGIELKRGDLLYLFSDGIVDQFGGDQGKKLKIKYFREKMMELSELPIEVQEKRLKSYLKDWKGGHSQTDDMTFVALEL